MAKKPTVKRMKPQTYYVVVAKSWSRRDVLLPWTMDKKKHSLGCAIVGGCGARYIRVRVTEIPMPKERKAKGGKRGTAK